MSKKYHVATVTVEPKKGQKIETKWIVTQDRPYPDITKGGGRMCWRNGGGLFGQYGKPAEGIGRKYHVAMLRGRTLGEVTGEIDAAPHGTGAWFRVRGGGESLTETESSFLRSQVLPALLAYIEANAESLKTLAVEGIREKFAAELREVRKELIDLEAEASAAVAALR